jgi:NAD(P)-dependent dehydrogenase (short-subunit alcohol dehydrogenase family)
VGSGLRLHFDFARGGAKLVLLLREERAEEQLAQGANVTAARVALLAVALDRGTGLVALEVAAVRATKADLASLADLVALCEALVALVFWQKWTPSEGSRTIAESRERSTRFLDVICVIGKPFPSGHWRRNTSNSLH